MSVEYEKRWYAKRRKTKKIAIWLGIFFIFIIIGIVVFDIKPPWCDDFTIIFTGFGIGSICFAVMSKADAEIKYGNPYKEKVSFIPMNTWGYLHVIFEYNGQTDHSYMVFYDGNIKRTKRYMGLHPESELKEFALQEILKAHGDISQISE